MRRYTFKPSKPVNRYCDSYGHQEERHTRIDSGLDKHLIAIDVITRQWASNKASAEKSLFSD